MPELAIYSYRIIKLDLTAGLTDFELVTDGRKITYATPSDGPEVQIRLQLKANDQIPLRPQGTINAPFQRLYVSASAIAKNIYLLVSSPDVSLESRDVNVNNIATVGTITSLTTLGTITNPVIAKPHPLYLAEQSQLFERGVQMPTGGVGIVNSAQVFNPVASGKTVVVLGANYGTFVAATMEIHQHNTALATLVGTFFNTNNGGANSVAELRTVQQATVPGANTLQAWQPIVNYQELTRFDILGPGEGLVLGGGGGNTALTMNFRIWEF